MTAGTWAVAAWCRLRKLSPWLGLVYALFVGQVIAFTRDLTEVLAYALVALAIYLYESRPRHRLWAGALFGLAALARETTLIFPLLYGIRLFVEHDDGIPTSRRVSRVAIFAALSFAPAVLWQIYLYGWLGTFGWLRVEGFPRVPFGGLNTLYVLTVYTLDVVQTVVVSGVICMVVGVLTLWREPQARGRVEVWGLALQSFLFVALMHPDSLYEIYGSARIAIPIVMCAIYTLAFVRWRGWFYFCAGLWLAPTVSYMLNPILKLWH